ncbi:MAG: hypothetical protein JWM93_377 [Frankiales bacterium]|nr:hypothetical protein [Frankiales bacterium]
MPSESDAERCSHGLPAKVHRKPYRTLAHLCSPMTLEQLATVQPGDCLSVKLEPFTLSMQRREDGSFLLHSRGSIEPVSLIGLQCAPRVRRGQAAE